MMGLKGQAGVVGPPFGGEVKWCITTPVKKWV